ncbi:unnamed protein product [Pleuronectes platessa]|uniref:Uncharacterized protein n=1 Tax=Pleuronectes platessa TaxID=8262 RepID=A0A9N7TS36_PLEPL|nr:unnamed protein product [Pleuronectes platessa]
MVDVDEELETQVFRKGAFSARKLRSAVLKRIQPSCGRSELKSLRKEETFLCLKQSLPQTEWEEMEMKADPQHVNDFSQAEASMDPLAPSLSSVTWSALRTL